MRRPTLPAAIALLCLAASALGAQARSLAQDPTLDNLVHPPGYQAAPPGTLGAITRLGTGPGRMILIPGLGFGGDVFDTFMASRVDRYTMYAVTLAGFGGTSAPAMPDTSASYATTPWTRQAIDGIVALMDRERMTRVTLVAHWALGSQIALRLALDHPERIERVVLIGGVAKAYYSNTPGMLTWTGAQRARYADQMARRWFKTVTRKTWDDQNFMTFDYAIHPLRALFLWRRAAEPPLSVWIRYLLEFYAIDLTPELAKLSVPTLVVRPGFDDADMFVDTDRPYMTDLCHGSWQGVEGNAPAIRFVTVPHSRLFIMYDRPDELNRVVDLQ